MTDDCRSDENRRFLRALARTGNATLAAAEGGRSRRTFHERKRCDAVFAAKWEIALGVAEAGLGSGGGARGADGSAARKTRGGELIVARSSRGRLQVCRAPAGRLTQAGERAFFTTVARTCNVTLAAQAAGVSQEAIYQRRAKCTRFAKELAIAVQIGFERLEGAMVEGAIVSLENGDVESWRHEAFDGPMAAINFEQAFTLLNLHRRTANELPRPVKPRTPMPIEQIHAEVVRTLGIVERHERFEQTGHWRKPDEPAPPTPAPIPRPRPRA